MDILKLTSIRLSKVSLETASKIGRGYDSYPTSHVIRIAVWVGLKFIKPGLLRKLTIMMWEEEYKRKNYSLEDVLQTAGYKEGDHTAEVNLG